MFQPNDQGDSLIVWSSPLGRGSSISLGSLRRVRTVFAGILRNPIDNAMELLVSHQRGRYGKARREVLRVLRHLGDERPVVERTAVGGIALVHTTLDGRDVVHRCRELFLQGFSFEHAVKWIPVDYWCEPDLDALRGLLAEKVRGRIAADETWGMKVARHGWQRYRTPEMVDHLARAIDRKVNLDRPDKLVRVDVVGETVAISVLRPGEIFSSTAPGETSSPTPVGGHHE